MHKTKGGAGEARGRPGFDGRAAHKGKPVPESPCSAGTGSALLPSTKTTISHLRHAGQKGLKALGLKDLRREKSRSVMENRFVPGQGKVRSLRTEFILDPGRLPSLNSDSLLRQPRLPAPSRESVPASGRLPTLSHDFIPAWGKLPAPSREFIRTRGRLPTLSRDFILTRGRLPHLSREFILACRTFPSVRMKSRLESGSIGWPGKPN